MDCVKNRGVFPHSVMGNHVCERNSASGRNWRAQKGEAKARGDPARGGDKMVFRVKTFFKAVFVNDQQKASRCGSRIKNITVFSGLFLAKTQKTFKSNDLILNLFVRYV